MRILIEFLTWLFDMFSIFEIKVIEYRRSPLEFELECRRLASLICTFSLVYPIGIGPWLFLDGHQVGPALCYLNYTGIWLNGQHMVLGDLRHYHVVCNCNTDMTVCSALDEIPKKT